MSGEAMNGIGTGKILDPLILFLFKNKKICKTEN